ncbi:hypothetical protein OSB04_003662 [Centaurea solstitialis]|uniref:Uncharacterized protein n=1 Tax=Centaurea solstitialis TaxID=347529 RepID=A0AA38WVS6_9ASTR|nr:hypothetical protein OSB04_003662 [Centaurea solstitialis]
MHGTLKSRARKSGSVIIISDGLSGIKFRPKASLPFLEAEEGDERNENTKGFNIYMSTFLSQFVPNKCPLSERVVYLFSELYQDGSARSLLTFHRNKMSGNDSWKACCLFQASQRPKYKTVFNHNKHPSKSGRPKCKQHLRLKTYVTIFKVNLLHPGHVELGMSKLADIKGYQENNKKIVILFPFQVLLSPKSQSNTKSRVRAKDQSRAQMCKK